MESISKIWFGPLPPDSPYLRPCRFYFIQNGIQKTRDLLQVCEGVSIIIYNKTRNVLVLVKQFRPAVYHGIVTANGNTEEVDLEKYPVSLGITLELCGGMIDAGKTWAESAQQEVFEETGYYVPAERIEKVYTYRSGIGSSSAEHVLCYCEVSDDELLASGGGVDDELIEVVEYTIEEAKELSKQGANLNSPASLLLGISWFLANRLSTSEWCLVK